MADKTPKNLLEKKFLLEKKTITLEDCILYVGEYHPEDKKWFKDLCMTPVEGNVPSFMAIKKDFYTKYFPQEETLSHRQKLFSALWGDDEKE